MARPPSTITLSVSPKAINTRTAAKSESGMATRLASAARPLPRKRRSTIETRTPRRGARAPGCRRRARRRWPWRKSRDRRGRPAARPDRARERRVHRAGHFHHVDARLLHDEQQHARIAVHERVVPPARRRLRRRRRPPRAGPAHRSARQDRARDVLRGAVRPSNHAIIRWPGRSRNPDPDGASGAGDGAGRSTSVVS
jgi:hypothetical protein